MATSCFEYVRKRITEAKKTFECGSGHVFRKEAGGQSPTVPVTVRTRWFKRCAVCRHRRAHSVMLRCFECKRYLHEGCASWASEPQEAQTISTDRAVTFADAPPNAEPAAVVDVVDGHVAAQRSASGVDDGTHVATTAAFTVEDVVVDAAVATECSVADVVDAATSADAAGKHMATTAVFTVNEVVVETAVATEGSVADVAAPVDDHDRDLTSVNPTAIDVVVDTTALECSVADAVDTAAGVDDHDGVNHTAVDAVVVDTTAPQHSVTDVIDVATNVDDEDRDLVATAILTVVDVTAPECSANVMDAANMAMDEDRDLAATAIVTTVNGAVPLESSTAVEVSATAAAGQSNVTRIAAAPAVTSVPRLDVHRSHDLSNTLEQWTTRFEQFSMFDHGVMADRASLYSGAPEVLAKRFADQHKTFNTVIDPFCGAGAIAIQLAKVCRKVVAMDSDPMRIKMARHNARVYGVEKNIRFVVGDFFERANRYRADAIVTSPPVGFCVGEGRMKIAALMRTAGAVAPKLLFRLPESVDRAELYRWASKQFSFVKFEEVCVDGLMNCVNFHLGHTTNINSYGNRTNAAVKAETRVLLYNKGLTGDRHSDFIRTNDLCSYDLYLREVEDFLERRNY